MFSFAAVVIVSALFSQVADIQAGHSRLPAVPPGQQAATEPVIPAAPAVSAAMPQKPNQLHLRNGLVILPKWNHVTVAATERAVLMSLRTEKKDEAGNTITVPITEGMTVAQGQILGHFDNRELRSALKINEARLEVAKAEKEKEIEIKYAAHGVQVSHAELLSMLEANKRVAKVFPSIDIRRGELSLEQARANLELQKYTIDVVKAKEVVVQENELERTKVLLELRQLTAPIDGIIVKVGASEGEWLREGDPVLEIMKLDTLWVQGKVSIKEHEISGVQDKPALVYAVFADGKTETFQGKVVFCHPKVEPGDVFHIYVEVRNRRNGNFWLLQPGRGDTDIVIQLQ